MTDKVVIVFSGFNQRAVIAFLRTLEANRLPYAIIAISNKDAIFLTDYKDKVRAVRKSIPLVLSDLVESINDIKEKIPAKEYIIAPSTEYLNRFLLQYRVHFESIGCKIPLVKKELYELISDKFSFSKLCNEHGIDIPKRLDCNNDIQIPFVAKPNKYFSHSGEVYKPCLILNDNDRSNFYNNYDLTDFYFEEYIIGESVYLLYYIYRNGSCIKFSQKNLIQQPNGGSVFAAISLDFHLNGESEKYENLFHNIDFNGLVMIEVRRTPHCNYMIEANPRFWGPSQLFVDAGINLFEHFLYDNDVLKVVPKLKNLNEKANYFWYGGVIETLKQNKKLMFHEKDELTMFSLLPNWLKADIYRRKDTINYFKSELI